MSDSCFDCANNYGSMCMAKNGCVFITRESLSGNKSGDDEKQYLDKLVDDHWKYIEGVLYSAIQYDEATEMDEARIKEIEFHYKSSAKHFWGHCREYHTGETL